MQGLPSLGEILPSTTSQRQVLLLHDGELEDVRDLLRNLGARCTETQRGASATQKWDLAVSTPHYASEISSLVAEPGLRRIVVLDHDSRTVRALIQRCGIHLVVRRPVHPSTLRLFFLHLLYRGTERRKPRIAIGTPTRMLLGLRLHPAILADLSDDGCRVFCERPIEEGQRLVVFIPDAARASRGLPGVGKVVWSVPNETAASPSDAWQTGVRFSGFTKTVQRGLQRVITAHKTGPATLPRDTTPPAAVPDAPDPPVGWPEQERRRSSRHRFQSRIVAHADQATRVLMGRDLSLGGVRVEPHPALVENKVFRLALHVPHSDTSIILQARVSRDDGEEGILLRFFNVSRLVEKQLQELMAGLSGIEERSAEGGEEIVLTEIVDDGDEREYELR